MDSDGESSSAPFLPVHRDEGVPPPVLDYQSPKSHPKLAILRRIQSMEALLAKAKLESEGIDCFVADELISVADPVLFGEVTLQVREDQLSLAQEILDRPPEAVKDGEYTDETWRCPKCHRKTVDLLPLSRRWQWAHLIFPVTLLSPFLLMFLKWVWPIPTFQQAIDHVVGIWELPWILLVASLGPALLLARRRKRCRTCGHEWSDRRPKESESGQGNQTDSVS